MAKFKIVTPSADSFAVPGASYELEMEALQGLDADIVEVPAGPEDAFVAAARDADASRYPQRCRKCCNSRISFRCTRRRRWRRRTC